MRNLLKMTVDGHWRRVMMIGQRQKDGIPHGAYYHVQFDHLSVEEKQIDINGILAFLSVPHITCQINKIRIITHQSCDAFPRHVQNLQIIHQLQRFVVLKAMSVWTAIMIFTCSMKFLIESFVLVHKEITNILVKVAQLKDVITGLIISFCMCFVVGSERFQEGEFKDSTKVIFKTLNID